MVGVSMALHWRNPPESRSEWRSGQGSCLVLRLYASPWASLQLSVRWAAQCTAQRGLQLQDGLPPGHTL